MYNLSPSFNWSAHGFTNEQLKSFIWDLGKAGFMLQLISLAGLHSTAVVTGTCVSSHLAALIGEQRNLLSATRRTACSPTSS